MLEQQSATSFKNIDEADLSISEVNGASADRCDGSRIHKKKPPSAIR